MRLVNFKRKWYKETCVNYAISLLKKRLMDLKAFPHEIEMFLGYPIKML